MSGLGGKLQSGLRKEARTAKGQASEIKQPSSFSVGIRKQQIFNDWKEKSPNYSAT